MTADRFTLDIDPEELTTAIRLLAAAVETLTETARRSRRTEASLRTRWNGSSGATVMAEMTSLSAAVEETVSSLSDGIAALRTLRRDYRAALEALPDVNRRWREAEREHAEAVASADRTHRAAVAKNGDLTDRAAADRAKEGSRDIADFARGRTQQVIIGDFAALKAEVRAQTRTAGGSLHATAWTPYTEWVGARGLPSWMRGFTPFELDSFVRVQTLQKLPLAQDIGRFEREALTPRSDWPENLALFDGLDVPDGHSYDVARAAVLHGRLEDLLHENDHLDTAARTALVRRWTDSLAAADLVDLTLSDPALVGNLAGFPEPYRYGANRLTLLDEEERFERLLAKNLEQILAIHEASGAGFTMEQQAKLNVFQQRAREMADRLRTVRQLTAREAPYRLGKEMVTEPPQVLLYEPALLDPSTYEVIEETHVAVVHGDLRAATNVATVIGGMTTSFDSFNATMTSARRLMSPEGVATIAWMEHEPPPVGFDWDMLDAASLTRAEAGADELVQFSAELDVAGDKNFFGHSYGGTTLARALKKGLDADTATFLGAPGPGTDVANVADLNSPRTKLYAASAPWDAVTWTDVAHGPDLADMEGVTRLRTSHGGKAISGHTSYYDAGTDMLQTLREVAAGKEPTYASGTTHVPSQPSHPRPSPRAVDPRTAPTPSEPTSCLPTPPRPSGGQPQPTPLPSPTP